MYVPSHFSGNEAAAIEVIRSSPLAVVTAFAPDVISSGFCASNVPLIYDPPTRTFRGHVARSNVLWRAADGANVLLSFRDDAASAYVSPQFYASRRQVPTWNFSSVFCTGRARAVHDAPWLRRMLGDLTTAFESATVDAVASTEARRRGCGASGGGNRGTDSGGGCPHSAWALSDAPADYVDGMLHDIVGLEITLLDAGEEGGAVGTDASVGNSGIGSGFVCQVKQTQNKGAADAAGVAAGLRRAGAEGAAAAVERHRPAPLQGAVAAAHSAHGDHVAARGVLRGVLLAALGTALALRVIRG